MLKLIGKASAAFSKPEVTMRVHPRRCTSQRHKSSKCKACVDLCQREALQLGTVGGEVEVDWRKCLSCGICSSVCPTDVFQLLEFDERRFLQCCLERVQTGLELDLICRQRGVNAAKGKIQVPCLGGVKTELLMLLAAAGIYKVHFNSSECGACRIKNGVVVLKNHLKEVNLLLSAFGEGVSLECTFKSEAIDSLANKKGKRSRRAGLADDQVSRRFFFRQVSQKSRKTATRTLQQFFPAESPTNKEEKSLTKTLPPSRALLIAAIVNLKESGVREVDLSESRRVALIQIDAAKCDRCGICHLFCPTGALKSVGESGGETSQSATSIEFKPLNCVKCNLCVDGCSSGAMTYCEEVPSTTVFSGEDLRLISWAEPPPKARKFDLNRILTSQSES